MCSPPPPSGQCGPHYHGIDCTVATPEQEYGAATSRILIPLQLKLPITTQGVGYQSVVNAYLRSLGREIIQEVALALNIDEERLSIDPVLDESHLAAPLSSFIDGATIQMELYLHPPLLMKPTDDENKVGTTQEMSEFSSLVLQGKWCNDVQWWFSMAHAHHDHQVTHVVAFCLLFVALLYHTALQTPTSAVRTQSRVLSHVDDHSCCSRTLLAAPSLSLRPSSGTVTFTMKSSDTTASHTVTLSNSVQNSNPAVIQTIQSKGGALGLRCTPPLVHD